MWVGSCARRFLEGGESGGVGWMAMMYVYGRYGKMKGECEGGSCFILEMMGDDTYFVARRKWFREPLRFTNAVTRVPEAENKHNFCVQMV